MVKIYMYKIRKKNCHPYVAILRGKASCFTKILHTYIKSCAILKLTRFEHDLMKVSKWYECVL